MQTKRRFWTSAQVATLVAERYGVVYSKRQIQRLLRRLGMYCYKPQPRDYRQPPDAEDKLYERLRAVADVLRQWGQDLDKVCVGFADESSTQLQANRQRVWSFESGLTRSVNSDKKKVNSFGFYAIRGNSVLSQLPQGNEEHLLKMLPLIRQANPEAQTILLLWDNHTAHLTRAMQEHAQRLGIILINLPTYSPNLNPIERIWKHIKKAVSEQGFVKDVGHLERIVRQCFQQASQKLSFAKGWIDKFWNQLFPDSPIPLSAKL